MVTPESVTVAYYQHKTDIFLHYIKKCHNAISLLYQGHAFRFPRAENIERGLSHCLSARAECHSLDLQNPKKA